MTAEPMPTRPFRLRIQWILCLLALSIPILSSASEDEAEGFGALPGSLAKWYKPENKRQVWLHTMFAMRRELQAVEHYAQQQDRERLEKWSRRLVKHYLSIPKMVPEWNDEVESDAAERLLKAAAEGDGNAAANAASRLARSCRGCHREFRALVAARYRAADFSTVTVADGNDGTLSHADAMQALSRTLNQIKIASEDEFWEQATASSGRLEKSLDLLGKTCAACHKDPEPRERILGAVSRAIRAGPGRR